MTNTVFEDRLDELNLSKKEFAQIVGMPYQTLMNWKQKGETPKWVDSWLENYEKGKALDGLLAIIEKYKK